MPEHLETPEQQVAVIEANALKICQMADLGYRASGEKGTVVLLRQLENNSPELEDWQFTRLGRLMSQARIVVAE